MAGGRIKGITVEIGGDTTGLQNALKQVNSSIKTTQSALKDVNQHRTAFPETEAAKRCHFRYIREAAVLKDRTGTGQGTAGKRHPWAG